MFFVIIYIVKGIKCLGKNLAIILTTETVIELNNHRTLGAFHLLLLMGSSLMVAVLPGFWLLVSDPDGLPILLLFLFTLNLPFDLGSFVIPLMFMADLSSSSFSLRLSATRYCIILCYYLRRYSLDLSSSIYF